MIDTREQVRVPVWNSARGLGVRRFPKGRMKDSFGHVALELTMGPIQGIPDTVGFKAIIGWENESDKALAMDKTEDVEGKVCEAFGSLWDG